MGARLHLAPHMRDAGGLVVAMLISASAEDGERVAEGIMTEMGSSPAHAAIDHSIVSWSIAAVRFALA